METECCHYCGYEMEEGTLNECDNCGTLYCEYCSYCEDWLNTNFKDIKGKRK